MDEITEDQARSVVIPIPTTAEEHAAINAITKTATRGIAAKEEAVRLSQESLAELKTLIPELEQLHLPVAHGVVAETD